jgi:hypothetical protein
VGDPAGAAMTRHAPAVYRAARDGFRDVSEALAQPGRPGDPHEEALAALRGVMVGRLRSARAGLTERMTAQDMAAYVLGASAVPAVLRVKGRRTRDAQV